VFEIKNKHRGNSLCLAAKSGANSRTGWRGCVKTAASLRLQCYCEASDYWHARCA